MSPRGGPGEEDMDEQTLQEKRDADFALMLQDCEGPLPINVRMCEECGVLCEECGLLSVHVRVCCVRMLRCETAVHVRMCEE